MKEKGFQKHTFRIKRTMDSLMPAELNINVSEAV